VLSALLGAVFILIQLALCAAVVITVGVLLTVGAKLVGF
jgi:hypothetical protein